MFGSLNRSAKAARRMKLPPVDLVLCSDAAIAKAMRPDRRSKVACYCHSPMRYAWEEEIGREYARSLPAPLRPLWPALCRRLRDADRRAAERVDLFIANSRHVAQRIKRCYGRDAVVIHPPVDVPASPAASLPALNHAGGAPTPPYVAGAPAPEHTSRMSAPPREAFLLCVGYHVPYKRLDLAVEACRALGKRLVVIGDGPDVSRLRAATEHESAKNEPEAPATGDPSLALGARSDATGDSSLALGARSGARSRAAPLITWLGWQPPVVINDHYRRAAALLFPGEEDFGIVPVEAMAHGCPVVAYGVGGATESVVDGQTGVLFPEQTVAGLVDAIRRCEPIRFDPVAMHRHAQQFGRPRFLRELRAVLAGLLGTRH